MKLELIDELISLGHGKIRSLDCVLVVKIKSMPELQILRAQKHFPKTAAFPVIIQRNVTLENFCESPLPSPFHLELAVIDDLLALKMSHLLGDGISMLLWLKVILGKNVTEEEIAFRSYPRKKDTPYRKIFNSDVWPKKLQKISPQRQFLQLTLDHSVSIDHFSLNDILIHSLFEILPQKRKAIWIPVNVRKNFWAGFGNGLSRMRVYPSEDSSLRQKLQHIKKQKIEAKSNGEISLPPRDLDLTNPVKRALVNVWLKRPWADWTTISLSHLFDRNGFFDDFEAVWGISSIMPAHAAAFFAVSNADKTFVTLSFDSECASRDQAELLLQNLKAKFNEAINDLHP